MTATCDLRPAICRLDPPNLSLSQALRWSRKRKELRVKSERGLGSPLFLDYLRAWNRPAEFRNVITIFPQKITDLKATNLSSKELKKLSFDKLANILPWMPEVFSLASVEVVLVGERRRRPVPFFPG